MCVTVPNFIKIGLRVAKIWRFNGYFFKWRPSAILDLLGAYWEHTRWPLGGLYSCAKFGWNRWSSFDTMKLSIFCPFGLKTPIHVPKIGVLGVFHPQTGEQYQRNAKRHILARVRVVWAIKRENLSTALWPWHWVQFYPVCHRIVHTKPKPDKSVCQRKMHRRMGQNRAIRQIADYISKTVLDRR